MPDNLSIEANKFPKIAVSKPTVGRTVGRTVERTVERTLTIRHLIGLICAILSPLLLLFRAIHCLYCRYIRWFHKNTHFDKYSEISLPADVGFQRDGWQTFQFLEMTYESIPDWKIIKQRMDRWSLEHFQQESNFVITEKPSRQYVLETVGTKKPSEVVRNRSHLIVYCPASSTVIGLCDHYYSDGSALRSFLYNICIDMNPSFSAFPKYNYIPLLSDAMVGELMFRQSFDAYRFPSCLSQTTDRTRVLTQTFYSSSVGRKWDRWCTFTRSTLQLFNAFTEDVEYLRVGITVGFDTDQVYANNRIGVIVVRIERPFGSYEEQFESVYKQYKQQATEKYTDAHTSYDILRNYSTGAFRKYARKSLDCLFTTLYTPEECPMTRAVGGFVGKQNDGDPYLYINVITSGAKSFVTYVTNLKQIQYDKLEHSGLENRYEFSNL